MEKLIKVNDSVCITYLKTPYCLHTFLHGSYRFYYVEIFTKYLKKCLYFGIFGGLFKIEMPQANIITSKVKLFV